MVDTAAGANAVVLPIEASVKAARVVGDTFIVQEDLFRYDINSDCRERKRSESKASRLWQTWCPSGRSRE